MSRKCHDCGLPLEEANAGEPCPRCGSLKSDITLYPEPIVARTQVSSPTIIVSPPESAPAVLLRAVVERGERTSEGDIIVSVLPAWRRIIQLLETDPSAAFQIDPRKWEEIIAGAYEEAGFDEVTLTPSSGDFGRDVIAVKRGLLTVRVIDQVKRYAPGHPVPADDVRALLGVLLADERATKGVVTTTSTFAPKLVEENAIMKFVPNRLELIDGTQLIPRLKAIADGQLRA